MLNPDPPDGTAAEAAHGGGARPVQDPPHTGDLGIDQALTRLADVDG
jgi:hypothetical protein